MSHRRGFTLVELIVVVIILVVLLGLVPVPSRSREIANRAVCAANLRSVVQGMFIYSETSNYWFPVAGFSDSTTNIVGFRAELLGLDNAMPDHPALVNNATASLWMLVRDGSANLRSYTCPSSGDKPDDFTRDGASYGVDRLWDFAGPQNLSFSTINMYHTIARRNWSNSADSDFVVMGDDNNTDGKDIHNLRASDRPDTDVTKSENSQNHFRDGQNVARADGSTSFVTNPFAGPDGDNVYAMNSGSGGGRPPDLANFHDDIGADEQKAANDVVLIPVTGNNGISLSGQPGPGWRMHPDTWKWINLVGALIALVCVAVFICLIFDGLRWLLKVKVAKA